MTQLWQRQTQSCLPSVIANLLAHPAPLPPHGWCDRHTDKAEPCPHPDATPLHKPLLKSSVSALSCFSELHSCIPPSYIKPHHKDAVILCLELWLLKRDFFTKSWNSPSPFNIWNQSGGKGGALGAVTSKHNLVLSPAKLLLAALQCACAKQMLKAGSHGCTLWHSSWQREKSSLNKAAHSRLFPWPHYLHLCPLHHQV